jgi:hypothetical protein
MLTETRALDLAATIRQHARPLVGAAVDHAALLPLRPLTPAPRTSGRPRAR